MAMNEDSQAVMCPKGHAIIPSHICCPVCGTPRLGLSPQSKNQQKPRTLEWFMPESSPAHETRFPLLRLANVIVGLFLIVPIAIGLVAMVSNGPRSQPIITTATSTLTTAPPTSPSGTPDSPQALQGFFNSLDSKLQWQGSAPLTGVDHGSLDDGWFIQLTGSPVTDVAVAGWVDNPQSDGEATQFLVSTAQHLAGSQCGSWMAQQITAIGGDDVSTQACESINLTFTATPSGDVTLDISW
jgi:hypothetical protein